MFCMWTGLKFALHDESGQDLIEWTLLLGFVALVSVALLGSINVSYVSLYDKINSAVLNAVSALH